MCVDNLWITCEVVWIKRERERTEVGKKCRSTPEGYEFIHRLSPSYPQENTGQKQGKCAVNNLKKRLEHNNYYRTYRKKRK